MFLKREIGYFIYFFLVLASKVFAEMKSDGFSFADLFHIISYSFFVTIIINILLLVIESFVSLIINQDLRFWRYFQPKGAILGSVIFLFILVLVYLLVPRIDSISVLIWGVIYLIGESARAYYNFLITRRG